MVNAQCSMLNARTILLDWSTDETHLLPMRSLKPWGMAADVLTASDMESNLFWLPTSVPGGGG